MGNNDRAPGNHIEVVSHPYRHLSDLLAAWLLRLFGYLKYTEPVAGPRTILVGRGGYDEHPEPKLQECEATLVAKDLGIADWPELRELLEYTLKVDRFGQAKGGLKFGRLVELLYKVVGEQRVSWWAEQIFEAFVFSVREWERFSALAPPRSTVLALVKEAFDRAATSCPHEATRRRLAEKVREYSQQSRWEPFSLPHCVAVLGGHLMWKFRHFGEEDRIGIVSEALRSWAADAFWAELERQRLYYAAAEDFERARDITLTIRGTEVVAYVVRSDHERVHSRLFNENEWVALVAVRRSNGQVQIFRRQRAPIRVSMKGVVAQLRACEREKAGEPQARLGELMSPMGPDGAGQRWFYHEPTENIFNGGRAAPEVTPTALSDEEIEEAILRVLDDSFVEARKQFARERT